MNPTPEPGFEESLPSTEQLMLTPERAALAALDVSLELAARLLIASHIDLYPSGRRSRDPDYEPHTADLLPIAERLVREARRLRVTIASYSRAEDELLHTAANPTGDDDSPA